MDGEDRFKRFELDHNPLPNKKIDPISVIDRQILVMKGDQDLPLHR